MFTKLLIYDLYNRNYEYERSENCGFSNCWCVKYSFSDIVQYRLDVGDLNEC